MEPLHRNARRVQAALHAAGSTAQVVQLDTSARTSAEAAESLGVDVAQIAKSMVFLADGDPVVVVASGADRIDTKALGAHLGRRITRADADAVRAATGYPIGGVSPAGLPPTTAVLVEKALAAYDVVWAAAGTPHTVFPTTYDELLRLTGGQPSDVRER
jgi:prolyl-tRNA editing enzyme YbaK/EbsC (Cys-tRNA(Pro) deacylase)